MILADTLQAQMGIAEHHYSQAKLDGKQAEAAEFLTELDRLWSDWEYLYVDAISNLGVR